MLLTNAACVCFKGLKSTISPSTDDFYSPYIICRLVQGMCMFDSIDEQCGSRAIFLKPSIFNGFLLVARGIFRKYCLAYLAYIQDKER